MKLHRSFWKSLLALPLALLLVSISASIAYAVFSPGDGVTSLTRSGSVWTITIASADASEVKMITPTQQIACSEHEGQSKNGHPLCDRTSYDFVSDSECVMIQVDWTDNIHNSSDPTVCIPQETSWPTSSPSPSSTPPNPTSTPSEPSHTPSPSLPPVIVTPTPTSPSTTSPTPPVSSPSATSTPPAILTQLSPESTAKAIHTGARSTELAETGIDQQRKIVIATWLIILGISVLIITVDRKRKKK